MTAAEVRLWKHFIRQLDNVRSATEMPPELLPQRELSYELLLVLLLLLLTAGYSGRDGGRCERLESARLWQTSRLRWTDVVEDAVYCTARGHPRQALKEGRGCGKVIFSDCGGEEELVHGRYVKDGWWL